MTSLSSFWEEDLGISTESDLYKEAWGIPEVGPGEKWAGHHLQQGRCLQHYTQ